MSLTLRWAAVIGLILFGTISQAWLARAQSETGTAPWSEPINVSQSGAATQPIIAVAPDGSLHVLWWDTVTGAQSASTVGITSTAWTSPTAVSVIFGERKLDPGTGHEIMTAPRGTRLVPRSGGGVDALWLDSKNQLLSVPAVDGNWGTKTAGLAAEAVVFDVEPGISETLHLAYIRSDDTADSPAGIYYRANLGTDWGAAKFVFGSPYFRSAQPGSASLSVAGDASGRAIVVWADPRTGQSVYAMSKDGGTTWSTPQDISGSAAGRAQRGRVAVDPKGTWLLIWQDSTTGGCGFMQRQSADGGQTWSAPEKVLSDVTRCTEQWTFAHSNDNRLWALGSPSDATLSNVTNAISVATWDGSQWSESTDVTLSSHDRATGRSNNLNCIAISVAGSSAGVVGCDPGKDVWVARSAVPLPEFISAAKLAWDPVELLSNPANPAPVEDLPALVADNQSNFYALWSQSTRTGEADKALYGATQTNQRWSRANLLLRSQTGINDKPVAIQPFMAIDAEDKIHAVWSSGTNGPVNYSWVYARDFGSATNWAEPIALPGAATASSWPVAAVDSRANAVYVMYAIPFNEHRGIYIDRSVDGGSTWLSPTVVFDAAIAKWDSADKPQIVYDEQADVLHAAWLQAALPGSTNEQAVYYARSTDQGQTWSLPVSIAQGNVDWPRLASFGADKLYVAWTESAPQAATSSTTPYGVRGRYSLDGGERWSSTEAVPNFEQVSSAISLSGNGSGQLFLAAVSQNAGGESVLSISRWTGQSWSDHEVVRLAQPATAGNAVTLFAASAVGRLSAAMRLQVLGQDNQGQFEVASTGRDIERAAIAPAPTFTPMPTMTPPLTATPEPTATPRPQLANVDRKPAIGAQGVSPLLLGGLLAAVVVVFIAVVSVIVRRRS
jgi:hypothetical protein